MKQITLQATYSALAGLDEVSALNLAPPAGWQLSAHQVETYKALRTMPPGGIVFNTAFTGDGKSLGGQLADLRGSAEIPKSLLMLPTKELARDQLGQLTRNLALWRPNEDIKPRLLDADELDTQSERRDLSRNEILQEGFA